MNKIRSFFRIVLELALLGGLLVGLAAVIGMLRAQPGAEQPGVSTPYLPSEQRLPTLTVWPAERSGAIILIQACQ
jgi:hypothetical protein